MTTRTNRGSAAKRSSGEAPAVPVGVAALPLAPQNQQAIANASIDAETAENNRKRMELERETNFGRQEHSLRNRLHDSGYVWIDDPGKNETYVGHIDDISDAMKARKVTHLGLERRAAVKGTKVVARGGSPVFFLTKDFLNWGNVQISNPDGSLGDLLIPTKADPEKTKARREEAGLDRKKTELERVNQPGFERSKSKSTTKRPAAQKGSSKKAASKKSGAKKGKTVGNDGDQKGDSSHPADEGSAQGSLI